jgi:hypothetical protein
MPQQKIVKHDARPHNVIYSISERVPVLCHVRQWMVQYSEASFEHSKGALDVFSDTFKLTRPQSVGQSGSVPQRANKLRPLVIAAVTKQKNTFHLLTPELVDFHGPDKVSVQRQRSNHMNKAIMLGDCFVVSRAKKSRRAMINLSAVRAGH